MADLIDLNHFWGADVGLGPSGDFGQAQGSTRSQQRILRRLLTNPRTVLPDGTVLPPDYPWHPTYGAGLPRYVGLAVDPAEIVALIRGQVLLEDAVAALPEPVITVSAITNGLAVSIRYTDADSNSAAILSFNVNQ
ncbi:MAG: hypothetical protein GAK28_04077 [Luteibacter sp.]|uniref:hypothetical protein n=1 Tax=Luteibacter sp. TaxID=1886636 RepID=UPI0013858A05|nr:hypothetical protein [Luteibacter sp.]KAF1004370.1 MAG: hypothetical protein GAK28_04077 [Luteibacter sp.]